MPDTLKEIILNEIKSHGAMNLGAFTSMALCHPEHGYYMNGDPFGAEGDFTTAPEISQMFGEVIGAWVIDVWMQMGQPSSVNLIECGPGRGTLMLDILRAGKSVDGFVAAVQIHFVEASEGLRQKQAETLKGYNVSWHGDISDITGDIPCIILGNEFLDALPIEQLKRGEKGWQKRMVAVNDVQEFMFTWADAEKELTQCLPSKTVSHKRYEVAPVRNQFISSCVDLLNASGGVALFIDYGYTTSHYGDTLQAVKKHEYVDVLKGIGACDITSHIDFDALSRHARGQGVHVEPIAVQGAFLTKLGIKHRLLALKNTAFKTKSLDDATVLIKTMEQSLDRLVDNAQMGDLFKVMCFHNGDDLKPAGF
ncbi:MAG: SAM-dependent methyltransferase [Alphaproteobacteria bacterium]|nr:MAG: SAM-dependent methyltransferase [Alphaproteobacteria bacterium]